MRLEGGTAPPPMIQEPKIDPASLRQNMQPAPESIVEPALPKLRDYEREAIDDRNSFSNKLLEALIGGLAGAGGRGIGEITNARMIRENSKLREAKQMNLRSPDSQISGHFRELAKMYSDPKEFTVTPQMSAEDIMEAMPWLKGKIGLDMNQQKLDYSTRPRTGGSGLPKKRSLGEKAEELIGDQSNVIEFAGELIGKVKQSANIVGKSTSSYQKALSAIPLLNLNDPKWVELEGQLKAFTKAYLKSMEGARPSDFDAVSYERITGNQFNSVEELVRLISNLQKSAEKARAWRLESASRNNKDVSGYSDMMKGEYSKPPTSESGGKVTLSVNGKIGEIPASKLKDFMKKYPNAKRVK
jgi:hypothetical protein